MNNVVTFVERTIFITEKMLLSNYRIIRWIASSSSDNRSACRRMGNRVYLISPQLP